MSHLDDREAVLVDVAIHALAIAMAVDGAIALTFDPTAPTPVVVYLVTIIAMFSFSAAYNLSRRWWLRRLDHASIGVLAVTTIMSASPMLVTLALLIVGGMVYLAGLVFLNWHSVRFHNSIWHSFVIVGASFHYAALIMGGK